MPTPATRHGRATHIPRSVPRDQHRRRQDRGRRQPAQSVHRPDRVRRTVPSGLVRGDRHRMTAAQCPADAEAASALPITIRPAVRDTRTARRCSPSLGGTPSGPLVGPSTSGLNAARDRIDGRGRRKRDRKLICAIVPNSGRSSRGWRRGDSDAVRPVLSSRSVRSELDRICVIPAQYYAAGHVPTGLLVAGTRLPMGSPASHPFGGGDSCIARPLPRR